MVIAKDIVLVISTMLNAFDLPSNVLKLFRMPQRFVFGRRQAEGMRTCRAV